MFLESMILPFMLQQGLLISSNMVDHCVSANNIPNFVQPLGTKPGLRHGLELLGCSFTLPKISKALSPMAGSHVSLIVRESRSYLRMCSCSTKYQHT